MTEDQTTPAADPGAPKKADPVKRLIACVIDGVIAGVLSGVFSQVLPFVGWILGAAYILFRDALPIEALGNKSIGKNVMKLDIVVEGDPNGKIDYMRSAQRNITLAIGSFSAIPIIGWFILFPLSLILIIIETIKVFTDPQGKRIGDNIAATRVVEL